MILQSNDTVRVPPFGMLALILLTVLTIPTWTLGEVTAQGVEETNMEALITVWPYDLSPSGLVVLPGETHWAVHPDYNGGSARGGDDRLIVVLQDPITRQGVADGFWPVIVKMPLSDARQLQADLSRVISTKPLAGNEIHGMESLIATAVYSLDENGQKTLDGEAVWKVMPRYGIVKLTKTRPRGPQDDGLEPGHERTCWGPVRPILLKLTVSIILLPDRVAR